MMSSSLYSPSNLLGYQNVLRVSEVGMLHLQVNSSHVWEPKWSELKDGVFRYANSEEDRHSSIFIPIENIIRLVTKENLIVMKTKNEKLKMKPENPVDLGRWIFAFQKSVALALIKIREKGPMSQLVSHDDYVHSIGPNTRLRPKTEDWTSEEYGGYGHGWQSQVIKTKAMMAQHAHTIAETKKSHRISNQTSSDDSLTTFLNKGRIGITDIPLEPERISRAVTGDIRTPPRSAPTSPLKMNYNPNGSSVTTPERHHNYYSDEFHSLGIHADVVMPEMPLSPCGREISGGSHLDGSECGSIGQTWRSVDDIASLDQANDHDRIRSRVQSEDSNTGFNMDGYDSDPDEGRNSARFQLSHEPGVRLISGHCSKLGPRSSNEDRCVAIPDLFATVNKFMGSGPHQFIPFYGDDRGANWRDLSSTPRTCGLPNSEPDAFFGVYDGHSGWVASNFLENVLHHSIYTHPLFEVDLCRAITETCINLDKQFLEHCRAHNIYAGTTAVGAVITENGRKLTVFNIGDSEAILCRNGQPIELTRKHSPNREDESARILAAQGWITEEKELYYGRLHRMDLEDEYILERAKEMQWTYIYRVCGEISVSRSVGDIAYKGFVPGQSVSDPFAWPDHHSQAFMADLVIPDPEFVIEDITEQDEFIILATDGLWDVIKRHEAVKRIRASLADGKSPQQICDELSDLAIRLGSSDNVTIIIVQFVHENY